MVDSHFYLPLLHLWFHQLSIATLWTSALAHSNHLQRLPLIMLVVNCELALAVMLNLLAARLPADPLWGHTQQGWMVCCYYSLACRKLEDLHNECSEIKADTSTVKAQVSSHRAKRSNAKLLFVMTRKEGERERSTMEGTKTQEEVFTVRTDTGRVWTPGQSSPLTIITASRHDALFQLKQLDGYAEY